MRQTRAAGWITGAVVLVLVIFVATYFFAASPRLENAALTIEQAEQIKASNDLLVTKTNQLKVDFAKLDEYRADVSALQVQIPEDAELADYTRTLSAIATAAGVTITTLAPGPATLVTIPQPPVVVVATPTADPTAAATPTPTPTPAADAPTDAAAVPAAAPVTPQIEGFASIPMAVTVVGSNAAVMAFLNAVQTETPRLMLVSSLTITRLAEAEASGGRPAIAAGDIELAIVGQLYSLRTPVTVVAVPADEEEAVPVLPASDRNPFVKPVG